MTATTQADRSGSAITNYIKDFGVLRDNKKSFWGVQALNVLDLIAYQLMTATLLLFLTGNLGINEINGGYVATAYTVLVSISLIVAGFLTDRMGIKKAALTGITLQAVCRLGVFAVGMSPDIPNREWIVIPLIILAAPGNAMMQAVFQAGNKLFSSERSRSASFNVWYLLMNLGFALGAMGIDIIRVTLEANLSYVYATGAVTGFLSIFVCLGIVKNSDANIDPTEQAEEHKESGVQAFFKLFKQSAFKRMLALMGVLLGVRSVFLYTYFFLPLYWTRTIEASSGAVTNQGFLQSINPWMIFIGVFLFIPLANKWNLYKMLVVGCLISASSMLFLTMPWNLFGGTVAEGYFMMSVLMLILLSFGEIIWSPKLYEYIAAVAPKGNEGAYLGMGMLPWFVAKTIVGLLSGHMLLRWCPDGIHTQIEAGTLNFWDSPEAMWLILASWAFISVLVAWIFRGWFAKGMIDKKTEETKVATEPAAT